MTHPLDGAFKRVDRAGKHLGELDTEIADYRRFKNETTLIQFGRDDKGNTVPLGALTTAYDAASDMSILVGEIVYNLRNALDYLVYELARLDSGGAQKRTQFPIESTHDGFVGRRKTFLKGVNDRHVAQIKALQPYSGCQWTQTLATFSNQDKHRELVAVATPAQSVWFVGAIPPPDVPDSAHVHRAPQADGTEVYVTGYFTVRVEFADGTLVPETLQKLKLYVADVLESFKPEFQ